MAVTDNFETISRRAHRRWPGCRVTRYGNWPDNIGRVNIFIPVEPPKHAIEAWAQRTAEPVGGRNGKPLTGWTSSYGPDDSDNGQESARGDDPVEAILNAIKAEREDAEETLAALAVWERV